MDRKDAIRSAYRMTGSNNFYDGMMTCSTLSGKAVCRLVWAMNRADCEKYPDAAMAGTGEQLLRADAPEVHRQQQRHRQHRHGYRKAVGRLHAAAGAEEQDDDYAADHQHAVDGRDIQLTLCIRRVLDLKMRQQVKAYRLGHERERTGYQRLRRDDRGCGAEHYRQRAQRLGQHPEEGVEHFNALKLRTALIADEPRALTEIVEYQAYLYERPRDIDIVRTDRPMSE